MRPHWGLLHLLGPDATPSYSGKTRIPNAVNGPLDFPLESPPTYPTRPPPHSLLRFKHRSASTMGHKVAIEMCACVFVLECVDVLEQMGATLSHAHTHTLT